MREEERRQLSWHHIEAEEALENLEVDREGLSDVQVVDRRADYGVNELPKKPKRTAIGIFLSQFANPMMLILVAAVGVSIALQEWVDILVIWIAILINVGLGFVEEFKADRSLLALSAFLPHQVRVRRDGSVRSVRASELVPGDILLISRGDKIPADARLISSRSLEANESALTGESSAMKKNVLPVDLHAVASDQENMLFAGTIIVAGDGEAVVVGTGVNTEIGRISNMVSRMGDDATPLQRQLNRFAKILAALMVLLAALVFLIGIIVGSEPRDMLEISVALAVAAIPEGLVIGTTVILAVGMQRILKRDALVRRLVASETLGSVSVICVDKTGTLTTGRMTVTELNVNGKEVPETRALADAEEGLLAFWTTNSTRAARNASGSVDIDGSATEIAIMQYLQPSILGMEAAGTEIVLFLPFDSTLKYAAAVVRVRGRLRLYAVGAPDVLLDLADISDSEKKRQHEIQSDMIARGQRVLMAAGADWHGTGKELRAQDVRDLLPLGYVGLQDPVRSDVKGVIEDARSAGLRTVMITGDHPQTALAIANELGIILPGHKMLTGGELAEMSDQELAQEIAHIDVYARVLPQQKVRIVRAWQSRGHSVAMTGDGVNDAPAIKGADIGISLGTGTEVAKETADIVLLKNDFSVIIAAIREGRIMFDNIRKLVAYLISGSFSELILVSVALVFSLPIPLLPAHILWINMVTNGFPAVALTFEPGEAGVMKEPPRKKNAPILNIDMRILVFIISSVTVAGLFTEYLYFIFTEMPIDKMRTMIFVQLGFNSLVYIFSVRKFRTGALTSDPFDNPWLTLAVFAGVILQVLPVVVAPLRDLFEFTSLTTVEWLLLSAFAFGNMLVIEGCKAIFAWQRRR